MDVRDLLIEVVDSTDPAPRPPRVVSAHVIAHTSDGGRQEFYFAELNDKGLAVEVGNSTTL